MIRREAFKKLGGLLAGGVGAATMVGRNTGYAANTAPTNPWRYPPPSTGPEQNYAGSIENIQVSPLVEARRKAASGLEQQRNVLMGWSEESPYKVQSLNNYNNPNTDMYLWSLKSPQHWWKLHVLQEKDRKRRAVLQRLDEAIAKIYNSPMDELERMVNDAASSFLGNLL